MDLGLVQAIGPYMRDEMRKSGCCRLQQQNGSAAVLLEIRNWATEFNWVTIYWVDR